MSEKPLSERQQKMLDFIHKYIDENGRPPTIREIGGAVNISSTSVVNYNLTRLKEKGLLGTRCGSISWFAFNRESLEHSMVTCVMQWMNSLLISCVCHW